MDKFTHLSDFSDYLFDDAKSVEKAKVITAGILQARSCRLSDIAREIPGNESAHYKYIQRFTTEESLKSILLRLYPERDGSLYAWRLHGDAATGCEENRVCGHTARWLTPEVIGC
jgi:hypothetical protein